ncbi:MAG: SH3 domain-containing protein [Anaerolineaceae bacterium]|nr:SH3 domain-containing protein [Anaerolineaceae bacterium]
MKCPHCKQEHPDNFQFCPETGLEIFIDCISNQTTDLNQFNNQNSVGDLSSFGPTSQQIFGSNKKKSIIIPILIFTTFIGIVLVAIGIFFLLEIFPVSSISLKNHTQSSVIARNTIDISKFLRTNTPEISSNTITTQNSLLNPSFFTDLPSDEGQEVGEDTVIPNSNQSTLQPSLETDLGELTPTPTSISISTLTPTGTNNEEYWEACPGYYLSRLHIGDKAKVSEDPPLSNRVRSKPNSTATILGIIEPGEKISILEGPSCNNRWIWWKMTSEKTGLTGWTVEGDNDGYWLVPIN